MGWLVLPVALVAFCLDSFFPKTYIATLEDKQTVDGPKRRVYYKSTWKTEDGQTVQMENQEGWLNGLLLEKESPSKLQEKLKPHQKYRVETVGNIFLQFGAEPNIVKVEAVD